MMFLIALALGLACFYILFRFVWALFDLGESMECPCHGRRVFKSKNRWQG